MSKQQANFPWDMEEKTSEGCTAERTRDKHLEVLLQWTFLQKADSNIMVQFEGSKHPSQRMHWNKIAENKSSKMAVIK